MKVGFTGTRKGMTPQQTFQLRMIAEALFAVNEWNEFHHGGAIGADIEAEKLIAMKCPEVLQRVWLAGPDPLARNRDIVAVIDVLIAAPEEDTEQLRSGTWATVRYARAAGKPVIMLSRSKKG